MSNSMMRSKNGDAFTKCEVVLFNLTFHPFRSKKEKFDTRKLQTYPPPPRYSARRSEVNSFSKPAKVKMDIFFKFFIINKRS